MNIQLNAQNISSEIGKTSYLVQIIVDGKIVKTDQHTSLNILPVFYQKWAYRTYSVENATVTVTETNWIS